MMPLDYSTVAVFTALLFVVLGLSLGLSSAAMPRRTGLIFFVVGTVFVAFGCSAGMLRFATFEEAIAWAFVCVGSLVFGFAFIFSGANAAFGLRISLLWNFGVATLNAAAMALFAVFFFDVYGLRSVAFSLASILLALPAMLASMRSKARPPSQVIFHFMVGIFVLTSALRLVFAFLDLSRDEFIPGGIDAWLFLLIAVSGFAAMVSCIAHMSAERKAAEVVLVERQKPRISLSERGLSAGEIACTLALIRGRTIKEIAADQGCSESTVRNTLAHGYRKLGVPDMVALSFLAGRHEIGE